MLSWSAKDKENFNHEFTFLYFFMLPVGAPGTLAEPQGSSACDSEDRGGDLAEKQTHSYWHGPTQAGRSSGEVLWSESWPRAANSAKL